MRNLDPIAVVYLAFFGFLVPLMVIRGGSRGRAGIGNPPRNKQATQIIFMELFFLLIASLPASSSSASRANTTQPRFPATRPVHEASGAQ